MTTSSIVLSATALSTLSADVQQAVLAAVLRDGGASQPPASDATPAHDPMAAHVDATGLARLDLRLVVDFTSEPMDPLSEKLLRAFAVKPAMTVAEIQAMLPPGYDLRSLNGFRSGMTKRVAAVLKRPAHLIQRQGDVLSVSPETSRALALHYSGV